MQFSINDDNITHRLSHRDGKSTTEAIKRCHTEIDGGKCVDINKEEHHVPSVNGLMKSCCCRSFHKQFVVLIVVRYGRDGNFLGFPFSPQSQTQLTAKNFYVPRDGK